MEHELTDDDIDALKDGEQIEIGNYVVARSIGLFDDMDGRMACIMPTESIQRLLDGEEVHYNGGDRNLTLTYSSEPDEALVYLGLDFAEMSDERKMEACEALTEAGFTNVMLTHTGRSEEYVERLRNVSIDY